MATSKILEEYNGFQIRTISSGSRAGDIIIVCPDGVISAVSPGSLKAAKRIIDNYIDKTFDMYAAA